MSTQILSTLQVFQSFSHECKSLFLQCCPKQLIQFLCECIINLLKGNLQSIKRHHVAKFQSEVRLLSPKRTTWKQRRDILASQKGLQLIKAQTFQTFTLLYLTPLVWLRLWFWIRTPKLKREEGGSVSKSERQKLQKLYTQGGVAYGSVHNLVKTSNLSVSKVRRVLHSKPSYKIYSCNT